MISNVQTAEDATPSSTPRNMYNDWFYVHSMRSLRCRRNHEWTRLMRWLSYYTAHSVLPGQSWSLPILPGACVRIHFQTLLRSVCASIYQFTCEKYIMYFVCVVSLLILPRRLTTHLDKTTTTSSSLLALFLLHPHQRSRLLKVGSFIRWYYLRDCAPRRIDRLCSLFVK